jgi:uncharacterized membrane protein YjjP (DUF1212 family)
MENNDYLSDKPANFEADDKFQRYNFARRIAETIIHKQKIGDVSKIVNAIENWLGSVDLEELKSRLDEIIKQSKKNGKNKMKLCTG